MNDLIYRITPTSVDTNPKDTDILTSQGDCKLIDQSQTRVLFKCYSSYFDIYMISLKKD